MNHMTSASTNTQRRNGADIPASLDRALGLFLVRESDQYRLELFNAMRELTYLSYRGVPEVEAIRRVGLSPLRGDTITVRRPGADGSLGEPETVMVEHIVRGGTRAILFYYGGYWHLWSQASAAKLSSAGVNEFTDILIDVVQRVRPLHLHAANFSRLIRSQAQGHKLASALAGNVVKVFAGEVTFELEGPRSNTDMMMFSMFAMVASMERNWIVQRLLAGRIAKWRRGEWPFGKAAIPFGYKLDAKTQALVPDPSKRDAVREMLLILCSDAPSAEKGRQLSRAGVRSARRNAVTGKHLPVSALGNVDQYVKSQYAWAAVWCHGEFLFRISNVFRDMDDLAGLTVVRDPRRDDVYGEFQMLYPVGVPEGGWAEPEVLRAFAQKAMHVVAEAVESGQRNAPRPLSAVVQDQSAAHDLHAQMLPAAALVDARRGVPASAPARARRFLAPWTGRQWVDGDFFYELRVRDRQRYQIARWPLLRRLTRTIDIVDADGTEFDDLLALVDADLGSEQLL